MARFTIVEFAKALRLGTTRDRIIHAGIILKTLSDKGKAPVVGKIRGNNGRPPLVYDLDDKVADSLGIKAAARSAKVTEGLDVWEVLALVNKIRESKGLEHMNYDDFATKLRGLRDGYKGGNNPYEAMSLGGARGCTRIFSKRSAFLIGRKISAMKARRSVCRTSLQEAA